jgi:F-type H+-transporting ATPase subunit epsilon
MTNKTMQLNIVSAEGELFSGDVSSVMVTGQRGEIGVHPGHTALITPIKPGQVTAKDSKGEDLVFYISGGMLEVQPAVVTVLADTALRAQDLDEAAAERAKQQAQEVLNQKKTDIDYATATAELAQAVAQLRAIQEIRKHLKG